MVDYKRPGSGTLGTSTNFTDQQYFSDITSNVKDTTITDSANLLATALQLSTKKAGTDAALISSIAAPADSGGTPTPNQSFIKQSRVVAYRRFDINAPDYEQQVEAFVEAHLNQCDRCNESPSYDGK